MVAPCLRTQFSGTLPWLKQFRSQNTKVTQSSSETDWTLSKYYNSRQWCMWLSGTTPHQNRPPAREHNKRIRSRCLVVRALSRFICLGRGRSFLRGNLISFFRGRWCPSGTCCDFCPNDAGAVLPEKVDAFLMAQSQKVTLSSINNEEILVCKLPQRLIMLILLRVYLRVFSCLHFGVTSENIQFKKVKNTLLPRIKKYKIIKLSCISYDIST